MRICCWWQHLVWSECHKALTNLQRFSHTEHPYRQIQSMQYGLRMSRKQKILFFFFLLLLLFFFLIHQSEDEKRSAIVFDRLEEITKRKILSFLSIDRYRNFLVSVIIVIMNGKDISLSSSFLYGEINFSERILCRLTLISV